jgi:AcrR family transcriptional regulator
MNKSPSRGRRAGRPDTRARIQDAARTRFLADGYDGVTLRAVAAEAGVDVALVSYYFGNKPGLFGAAMALPTSPPEVLARTLPGDPATLAARLLTNVLALWDNPDTGAPLRAMAMAAPAEPKLGRLVSEAVGDSLVRAIAAHLGGDADALGRAAAFTAQVSGVIYFRYLLRVEPFASMAPEEIVARLAPSLQLTLGERSDQPL